MVPATLDLRGSDTFSAVADRVTGACGAPHIARVISGCQAAAPGPPCTSAARPVMIGDQTLNEAEHTGGSSTWAPTGRRA